MADRRPRVPFHWRVLIAMGLGLATGLAVGPRAAPLGELGKLLIQLVKLFALPLLVFAILDAFLKTEIRWREAGRMLAICAVNAAIALAIGLGLSNWLQPGFLLERAGGTPVPADAPQKLSFLKNLTAYFPANFVDPIRDQAMIPVILLTVLAGAALRSARGREVRGFEAVEGAVDVAFRVTYQIVAWIILLIPLAVFGVVARVVGEQGLAPLGGLAAYLGVALLGLAIHVGVVYQGWLVLKAKVRLRDFWREARDPVVYALGASSSLATLPVTLDALERMKVSPKAARLAACVGTNLNNDGILLYEAMAVLFVAQAHGLQLGLGEQLLAAAACVVAGVGISGVPDAGLISLSVVLVTVGLPVELLPLLLTVDWILSRARAATNVVSDLVVAVLLDRAERRR